MTRRYHPPVSPGTSSIDGLPSVDELHSLAESVRLTFEARRLESELSRLEIELTPSLH